MAYSIFEQLTFSTAYRSKSFDYQTQNFRSITLPQVLVKQGRGNQYVDQIKHQGVLVRVTSLERTVVDVLDRPELSGGWEEIWRSLDHLLQFDCQKLIDYTLLLQNATTVAKVGYFLEQRPKHLEIDSKYIKKLLPYIPKQPHYMDRSRNGKGGLFNKWHLIVPIEIIKRSWEEPYNDDI